MSEKSPFVVSPEWLVKRLRDPGLSIIDGSWYLPAQNRDARAEYDAAHVPGAIFFDQDQVVEPDTGLPPFLAIAIGLCPPCQLDGYFPRRHDRCL